MDHQNDEPNYKDDQMDMVVQNAHDGGKDNLAIRKGCFIENLFEFKTISQSICDNDNKRKPIGPLIPAK